MSVGPIPLSEIGEVADRLKEPWEEFTEIIQHMDSVYLEMKQEELESKRKSEAAKKTR